jgi:hypothetical protein
MDSPYKPLDVSAIADGGLITLRVAAKFVQARALRVVAVRSFVWAVAI